MKSYKNNLTSLLGIKVLLISLTMSSCDMIEEENPDIVVDKITKQTTYFGPANFIGNGKAQTFITLDKDRKPVALGIAMSERSMENLPTRQEGHEGRHSFEYLLMLPQEAKITPFKFASIEWNPLRPRPEGFYVQPHFDFPFYLISNRDRFILPLPASEMDTEIPLAKYLPAGFIQLPGRIDNMGVHWIPLTSRELNGDIFTKNFIFGTNREKMAFMGPKFSTAYINNNQLEAAESFSLPEAFQVPGYYPSKYEYKYNAVKKEHLILMTEFSYKTAD